VPSIKLPKISGEFVEMTQDEKADMALAALIVIFIVVLVRI
jgi:hypothetical protein